MRGYPVRNFIAVLFLLMVMALAVAMTTHRDGGMPDTNQSASEQTHDGQVSVMVRMLFSHPPEKVSIPGFGINEASVDNEIEFTLRLPAEQIIELPLDIRWKERDDARFFTQITIRQDGREDDVHVFADQAAEFFDTFSIDTHTQTP